MTLAINEKWSNSNVTAVYVLELYRNGIYVDDYIGNTTDPLRRMIQHQNGDVFSTKDFTFKVFDIMHFLSSNPLQSREEASIQERKLQVLKASDNVLYKNWKVEVASSREFVGKTFDKKQILIDYDSIYKP